MSLTNKQLHIPKKSKKKQYLKKLLSLLAAAAVMLSLSACKLGETGQDLEPSAVIEPPEDGWTLEELNQVLYMNGQKIELPLMFSSLKEGYEIKEKQYSNEANSDRTAVGNLYYGNEFVAIVAFNELEKDISIGTLLFETSYYEESQNSTEYIILNGLRLNDDASKIEECLGKDFIIDRNIYKYCLGNEKQFIIIDPNKKGYMIMINVRGENQND